MNKIPDLADLDFSPEVLSAARALYESHREDLKLIVPEAYSSWESLPIELKRTIAGIASKPRLDPEQLAFLTWSFRFYDAMHIDDLVELASNGADLRHLKLCLFHAVTGNIVEEKRSAMADDLKELRLAVKATEKLAARFDSDCLAGLLRGTPVSSGALREQVRYMRIAERILSETCDLRRYGTEDYLLAKTYAYVSAAYTGTRSLPALLASVLAAARIAASGDDQVETDEINEDSVKHRINRFRRSYPKKMNQLTEDARVIMATGNHDWKIIQAKFADLADSDDEITKAMLAIELVFG